MDANAKLLKASKDVLELLGRIITGQQWGAIEEYADALQEAIDAVEKEQA
jgi:hypothetical protein